MTASRVWVGVATAIGVAALLVVSVGATALLLISTCDGDGGYPFSARDSTAGRFCESSLAGPWVFATAFGPAAVVLLGGVLAAVARRWARLGVAFLLAGGLLAGLVVAVVALPDSCGDRDQAAYDAWAERGFRGPQPSDCDTY